MAEFQTQPDKIEPNLIALVPADLGLSDLPAVGGEFTPAPASPAAPIVPSNSDFRNLSFSGLDTIVNSGSLMSNNFRTGVAGWRINADGEVEFFSGTFRGTITATGGTIAGWVINTTSIADSATAALAKILIDSANTLIRVGASASNNISIDGANARIRSSDYVAGTAGFTIEPGLIEAQNLLARGMLRGSTFAYDVISAIGGQLLISNADVLDTAMDANDGTLADSYSESNSDNSTSLYSGVITAVGQSFANTNAGILNSCKFYLKKTGSPTGNAVAILYAHTGTYGTSSVPTGAALATSDNFDVSTLTTSDQLITFTFTGAQKYALAASTNYCIVIEYSGGNSTNKIQVGIDSSTPTHSGNRVAYLGGWTYNTADTCFYIYLDNGLTIKGTTTFAVNDMLQIRAVMPTGILEEFLRVTRITAAPIYSVTRDLAGSFAADSNPAWPKSTTVVKVGVSDGASAYSGGWLRLLGEGTNSPHYSVFARTGVAYNAYTEQCRLGNLNGFLGYSSEIYGIAVGESTKYLKYDSTNGLRIAGDLEATRMLAPSNFTSGEALTAGDAVYFKASDSKIWKTDTDADESTYNFIGFAADTYLSGATTCKVVIANVITKAAWGLTAGSWYFLTGTAGAIGTTPGTRVLEVGVAISATELLIIQRKPRIASNTATLNGAATSTITTGFRPATIIINATQSGASNSKGSSDGTTNQCTYHYPAGPEFGVDASFAWRIFGTSADRHLGVCDTFTATGFRLNQTKPGSGGAQDIFITWLALG